MLYENIKAIALEQSLSIRALERKAGLSQGTINKWHTSMPTVENLVRVATALDVPLEKLLKGAVSND